MPVHTQMSNQNHTEKYQATYTRANRWFVVNLLIGAALSSVLYLSLVHIEQQRLDEQLKQRTNNISKQIEAGMHHRNQQVHTIASFFSSSD